MLHPAPEVKSSPTGSVQRDACVLTTLHCKLRHLMWDASHESARSQTPVARSHDAYAMALQTQMNRHFLGPQNLSNRIATVLLASIDRVRLIELFIAESFCSVYLICLRQHEVILEGRRAGRNENPNFCCTARQFTKSASLCNKEKCPEAIMLGRQRCSR